MTGRYSSRGIEEACKTNINLMWLLNEAEAPDHNTIDRFRKDRANEALEDLFSQLVIKLKRGSIINVGINQNLTVYY